MAQRNLPGLLNSLSRIGFNQIAVGEDYAFKSPLENHASPQARCRRAQMNVSRLGNAACAEAMC